MAAKKKTALSSTGVDAVRDNSFRVYPEELVLVGRDPGTKVGDLYYDPRVLRAPDKDMVASIKEFGVLQEPAVIKGTVEGREALLVGFGRGRVISAREANRELVAEGKERLRVRVHVFPRGTSPSDIEAMMAVENTHRLEETALDLADKLAGYISRYGEEDLPKMLMALKLDRRRADKLLALREAPPELKRELKTRALGLEAALAFAQLPAGEQMAAVAEAKAKAGGRKVSAELARETARTRQGKQVQVSKQQLRMLLDYADAHGWPQFPGGVPFLGWVMGRNAPDDTPGLVPMLKKAQAYAAKKAGGAK